jgi:hypothetical protein
MPKNINISPVISPDILKTISASSAIKTFGDQLKDKAKEIIISIPRNKTSDLQNQIENLTEKEIQSGVDYNNSLKRLSTLLNQKQITVEQYNTAVNSETLSYNEQKAQLNIQKQQLQKNIQAIASNPYDKIKNAQKTFKTNIKNNRKTIENINNKSKKDLVKQVTINLIKSLPSVLGLQLTNSFATIISQRKKLEILVDQVNLYIDTQVKDQATVTIATNLRNNALALINSSIRKLQAIERTLKTITRILTLLTTIIAVIERILSLPIPALIPVKIQLQPKLQKILRLLSALGALLCIATISITNEIQRLIELRERLKQISLQLEVKAVDNLTDDELAELSNEFLPMGINEFGTYKGFTFKIKEEQNPKFVVKGNKRRYAVAIDRYNVEVLKSEFSFTLDPNDLVEQLKLVIDQQNLQG